MRFWSGLVFSTVFLVVTARAELKVYFESDGAQYPLVGSKGTQILVRKGTEIVPLAGKGEWKLSGDLYENAGDVVWLPSHSVKAFPPQTLRKNPNEHFVVGLGKSLYSSGGGQIFSESEARTLWPQRNPMDACGVMIWVVKGMPTRVQVEPQGSDPKYAMILTRYKFGLQPNEDGGFPVYMLWANDHPLAPLYPQGSSEEAFAIAAACLDRTDTLAKFVETNKAFKDLLNRNLLHFAAGSGAEHTTDLLLAKNPKLIAEVDNDQMTPLDHAAADGRLLVVEHLLAAHASARADKPNISPLYLASAGGHAQVVAALLQAKADPDLPFGIETPLATALDNNFPAVAENLVAGGASFRESKHIKGLVVAKSAAGANEMVEWLLKHGLDANFQLGGLTPLMAGALHGNGDLVRLLIQAGAKVNEVNRSGESALRWAAEVDNVPYAEALLKFNAVVDAKEKDGSTPLLVAATGNHPEMVKLLFASGANLQAKDNAGFNALDRALLSAAKDVIPILISHGAQISLGGPHTDEVIEQAVVLDQVELIKTILTQGWSANSPVSGGWTLGQLAGFAGARQCIALLNTTAIANTPAPAAIASLKELDAAPKLISKIDPEDPRSSVETFPQEEVHVSGMIDRDGHTRFLHVITGSQHRLNMSVLNAVSQWKFAPLTHAGKPVAAHIVVPVIFRSSAERHYISSQIDQVPVAIVKVNPVYPREMRANNYEGNVILNFVVGVDGHVRDVQVLQATDRVFAISAADCIRQWVFRPGTLDEKPVVVRAQIPFSFTLSN